MTGDEVFLEHHRVAYEKFIDHVSEKTKQSLHEMVTSRANGTMLSPQTCLHISALPGFTERNIIEMLHSQDEILEGLAETPYRCSRKEMQYYESAIIPLIEELEKAGFCEYWRTERLPQLEERCAELNDYTARYDMELLINQYKNPDKIDNSDFTNYISAFTRPLGIKLCGNNLISSTEWDNTFILSTVAHESFHPPYDKEKVAKHVDILAKKPWFSSIDFNDYITAEGFVEENIVEALGVYVAVQLGLDMKPDEYFKTHDGGTHVLSPYFYKYLCDNKKIATQSFEDYFIDFVENLNV